MREESNLNSYYSSNYVELPFGSGLDIEDIKQQNAISEMEKSLAWGNLKITRELSHANEDIFKSNLRKKRYRQLAELPDKLPKLEQMVQTPYFDYRYIGNDFLTIRH